MAIIVLLLTNLFHGNKRMNDGRTQELCILASSKIPTFSWQPSYH
jgi:hypothetical protein